MLWMQIRWYVPAGWRADYDEPPRICAVSGRPEADPYLLVPISILFYLSPDIFVAFCLLQCAYTDAVCNIVEDPWVSALFVYGLVRGPHPAAALAPLALWLVMSLLSLPFDCGMPIGMADAKLYSVLGLVLGAAALLKLAALSFLMAGVLSVFLILMKKRAVPLAPLILAACLAQ